MAEAASQLTALPGPWSWSPANVERGFCAQVWDSNGNNIVALASSDEGSVAVSTIADRHNQDIAALHAEIGRLRVALRVNGLRMGATDTEIDAVLYPEAPHG